MTLAGDLGWRPWLAYSLLYSLHHLLPLGGLKREEASVPCHLTLTAGTVCTQIRGPPACHSSLVWVISVFCKAWGLLGLDQCPLWLCTQRVLQVRVALLSAFLALWMLSVGDHSFKRRIPMVWTLATTALYLTLAGGWALMRLGTL